MRVCSLGVYLSDEANDRLLDQTYIELVCMLADLHAGLTLHH